MQFMRSSESKQQGQSLLIVAVSFALIVALLITSTDIGLVTVRQQTLRNAADAATLSAGTVLAMAQEAISFMDAVIYSMNVAVAMGTVVNYALITVAAILSVIPGLNAVGAVLAKIQRIYDEALEQFKTAVKQITKVLRKLQNLVRSFSPIYATVIGYMIAVANGAQFAIPVVGKLNLEYNFEPAPTDDVEDDIPPDPCISGTAAQDALAQLQTVQAKVPEAAELATELFAPIAEAQRLDPAQNQEQINALIAQVRAKIAEYYTTLIQIRNSWDNSIPAILSIRDANGNSCVCPPPESIFDDCPLDELVMFPRFGFPTLFEVGQLNSFTTNDLFMDSVSIQDFFNQAAEQLKDHAEYIGSQFKKHIDAQNQAQIDRWNQEAEKNKEEDNERLSRVFVLVFDTEPPAFVGGAFTRLLFQDHVFMAGAYAMVKPSKETLFQGKHQPSTKVLTELFGDIGAGPIGEIVDWLINRTVDAFLDVGDPIDAISDIIPIDLICIPGIPLIFDGICLDDVVREALDLEDLKKPDVQKKFVVLHPLSEGLFEDTDLNDESIQKLTESVDKWVSALDNFDSNAGSLQDSISDLQSFPGVDDLPFGDWVLDASGELNDVVGSIRDGIQQLRELAGPFYSVPKGNTYICPTPTCLPQ